MGYNNSNIFINVLQWNAQSIRPKKTEFEALLNQEKVHVAIISETWLDRGSYFRIREYNTYRADRADGYAGVAILTHKSVNVQLCNSQISNPDIDLLHIKLLNCDHLENVVGVYCPQWVRTTSGDWDQILNLGNEKTLIAGDFNGHHSNWSSKSDTRGRQIFESIFENSYISLNDGAHTRVKLVNGIVQNTSPDISIVSVDNALKYDWLVLNENLGSDHLIIKMKLNVSQSNLTKKKRNFKKAEWTKYRACLESELSDLTLPEDNQAAYDLFINAINKAANLSIPFIRICENPIHQKKFTPRPYWNQDLSKAVAERRRALGNFRKNSTPDNLQVLQDKIRTAQRLIRNSSSTAWQNLCNSIDSVTSSKEMWAKMRWLKGYKSPKSSITREKAEELLSSLAPDYATPAAPEFVSVNMHLCSPISVQELTNSIKQSDTAPGVDDISYSMIKNLPKVAKFLFVSLLNRFLSSSFVPSQWKEVKVVPVPKPGPNNESVSSTRPISLLSCPCKILHTIITRRLEWYFERNNYFSDETVGFRRARSCMDNLSRLVTRIQMGFARGHPTVGCFVDIDSAYNNVNVTCLLNSLDLLGVGAVICKYLWEFLHERHLSIDVDNNETLVRTTGTGVAQGDPSSPVLFNAATIKVCKSIPQVFVSQYADDFVLYTSSKKVSDVVPVMQSALNSLNEMVEEMGLNISHRKTKVCVFTKGQPRLVSRYKATLIIDNHNIPQVDRVKYLGIWFDNILKWTIHINEIRDKALKFLNVFKVLAGTKWGIHPKHLRRLYIAIIRSRFDYGSFLYDNSANCHLEKLDKVQNQAMRVVGGFIKTTPVHVMESELCLHPLFIRRRYLAAKFWLRSRSLENNLTLQVLENFNNFCEYAYWRRKKIPLLIDTHRKYCNLPMHSDANFPIYSLDKWISSYDLSDSVVCNIDGVESAKRHYNTSELRNICSEFIDSRYGCFYKLYTDGSKDDDRCGSALFDPQVDTYVKVKIQCDDTSIMHCELIAISEALSYLASVDCNKCVIFSDSKSALYHLARLPSTFRGHPLAYDILQSICRLRTCGKEIVIQWVPSHVGIQGNEEADNAAREALTDGVPYTSLPLTSELLCKVKL